MGAEADAYATTGTANAASWTRCSTNPTLNPLQPNTIGLSAPYAADPDDARVELLAFTAFPKADLADRR
jgi:hypothetical protein